MNHRLQNVIEYSGFQILGIWSRMSVSQLVSYSIKPFAHPYIFLIPEQMFEIIYDWRLGAGVLDTEAIWV